MRRLCHVRATIRADRRRIDEFPQNETARIRGASAFSFLDEFPRTPNGKIDRRALPAPDLAQQTLERAFVPARNHLERQIVHIWEKVLNVRPIGVTSNFFELGGYSLLAVRVMRQVEKVFNKKVPVTALFQHPTVEQLARFLNEESSLAPWSSLVPLQPKGSQSSFLLDSR